MAAQLPPHLEAAVEHLKQRVLAVEGKPLDVLKVPWDDLEKPVIKLLGGPFRLERPEHQAVALGLAGVFGLRLSESDRAFWFPNREAPEAAMVGFPDALMMLSPFGAVLDALGRSKLALLDQIGQDIRRSLAQARFSISGGTPPQLGPADYQRLFDPGFIQFIAVDAKRLATLLDSRPDALTRELRDALSRAGAELSQDAKSQFEQQVTGALGHLDAAKPLSAQLGRAPRLAELLIHLFATSAMSGAAPEEFWQEAVLPLLYIGAPAQFPPLEKDEVQAVKEGVDPFALFLDVVPYQQPAPEDGLLGVFDLQDVTTPHPDLGPAGGAPRLLKVKPDTIQGLAAKLDVEKSKQALAKFSAYLQEKSGAAPKSSEAGKQMIDAAFALLGDLKRILDQRQKDSGELQIRRLTEAEAMSEAAIAAVRKLLQGPRIILSP